MRKSFLGELAAAAWHFLQAFWGDSDVLTGQLWAHGWTMQGEKLCEFQFHKNTQKGIHMHMRKLKENFPTMKDSR